MNKSICELQLSAPIHPVSFYCLQVSMYHLYISDKMWKMMLFAVNLGKIKSPHCALCSIFNNII